MIDIQYTVNLRNIFIVVFVSGILLLAMKVTMWHILGQIHKCVIFFWVTNLIIVFCYLPGRKRRTRSYRIQRNSSKHIIQVLHVAEQIFLHQGARILILYLDLVNISFCIHVHMFLFFNNREKQARQDSLGVMEFQ